MPTASNIIELRQLVAERFPHLRQGIVTGAPLETSPTGVPGLDALLGGGLPRGEFTELVGTARGSGSVQVIHAFLRRVAADGQFLALIDGQDSFDVGTVCPKVLARLLWVRCTTAEEALKAADLLLRDQNFPLVALDLKFNPLSQLRKIPTSIWHRLGRLLERNRATVLVVTPFPLVSGVRHRLCVESNLGIDDLALARLELLDRLQFTPLRSPATAAEAQTG